MSLPVRWLAAGALVGVLAATGCSSGDSGTSGATEPYSFASATGGTTFFVNLTVVRRNSKDLKAQLRLAMSPEVTAETFAYAVEACGWEEE